jgi:hypothetical protein
MHVAGVLVVEVELLDARPERRHLCKGHLVSVREHFMYDHCQFDEKGFGILFIRSSGSGTHSDGRRQRWTGSELRHWMTQTVRSLARTQWGHSELAATVHRDEPSRPATGVAAEARAFGRFGDFLRCLDRQPESREPWLRALIGEIREHRC